MPRALSRQTSLSPVPTGLADGFGIRRLPTRPWRDSPQSVGSPVPGFYSRSSAFNSPYIIPLFTPRQPWLPIWQEVKMVKYTSGSRYGYR